MDGLSLDSILGEEQINNLFSNEDVQESPPKEDLTEKEDNKEPIPEETETIETDPNILFGEESESVDSEENIEEKKDTQSNKGNTSSDFYSSIANALVEDGVLQNLDDEDLSKIKSAEDFAELMSSYINNQLDEKQKRISEALELGLEPTEIQKYEGYMNALNAVTEDKLTSEDEAGENLRKNLIYQDCLNKGYSKERAMKVIERSFKAGTDIEDAREALQDNKDYFKKSYDSLLNQAREEDKKEKENIKKQAEELKSSILNEEKAFGDIVIDKNTRQKVYDSITRPVYTDPESGEKFTAIQKYESENRTEFLKNVGLLFVLTDGFKNIDRLVNDKVKKETKKSLRSLEHTLKGSNNGFRGGTLSFANNSGDSDPESLFKGWKLSI